MNLLSASVLIAATFAQIPAETTVSGVSLSIEARDDKETMILKVRTAVSGDPRFIFNPQFTEYLGVPGRVDVYDEQGRHLGDLLPVLDPFLRLKQLAPHDWFYLRGGGAVESELRFRFSNMRVFRDPEKVRIVAGQRSVPLRPGETYSFQLVTDERFLSTPEVMRRFDRGSRAEQEWQRNTLRHKAVIRSKPVRFTMPESTNALFFKQKTKPK